MKWTGERLVTQVDGLWGTIEHLHRYALAQELCVGKIVLDIASGEGYGSNLIASVASQVHGVDISAEAVAHAAQKYKRNNLQFSAGSATAIPLPDASVEVVISFETLEHLKEHDKMFQEFKRVLKPNGLVLLSSPEKSIYARRDPNNPYHLKEITLPELKDLVGHYFKHSHFFSQRIVVGSLVNVEGALDSGYRMYDGDFTAIHPNLDEHDFFNVPFFNLAICSDGELSPKTLPGMSFFSGYRVYEREIAELRSITKTRAFRLGNFLILPFRYVKNLFYD